MDVKISTEDENEYKDESGMKAQKWKEMKYFYFIVLVNKMNCALGFLLPYELIVTR